ncbi:hypothetical protein PWP93_34910 [Paraburkholderia sp. A1RI-2L]|uniref:hypothetical protein n=1 Tax=Paraburkholderia sp. A1RI-2L TaxID=3028367 RepID=UPI003B7D235B
MSDTNLVLNAGSSSIKFSVFPGHRLPSRQDLICEGQFGGVGGRLHFMVKDATSTSMAVDDSPGTTHEDALTVLRGQRQVFDKRKRRK